MPPAGGKTTPPIFFPEKENGRCDRPKERRFPLRASSSKKCGACRLHCLRGGIASLAANGPAKRFASASIIRCRSAHLVGVRSNSRLPPVSTMRRAKQCRYFASSLPPSKRHSRLTIVRRGCKTVTIRRDSWRSHVHRTYIAQRVQLFKLQSRNVGGRGGLPSHFSWGSKGGILFGKRIPPLTAHSHANGRPPRALWARYLRRYHVSSHRQQCHAARKAHHRRL